MDTHSNFGRPSPPRGRCRSTKDQQRAEDEGDNVARVVSKNAPPALSSHKKIRYIGVKVEDYLLFLTRVKADRPSEGWCRAAQ
jgi:hypothetical protein